MLTYNVKLTGATPLYRAASSGMISYTMEEIMEIRATFFDKTKKVRCDPHNMTSDETPDEILLVEDSTDEYALLSPQFKNKKVAIVHREDWLNAKCVV